MLLHCIAFLGIALSFSCASPDAKGRFERHAVPEFWWNGIQEQFQSPEQFLLAGALIASVPAFAANDGKILDNLYDNNTETRGNLDTSEDIAGILIGTASVGLAGWEWYEGDDGRSMEVLAESLLTTQALVALLKVTVDRKRPRLGSTSSASFPSGHSAAAFSAATFLARRVQDSNDGLASALGYTAYAPALLIGYNRVKKGKHHPSDVAAGAAIGVILTNWNYNSHYGRPELGLQGIFGKWDLEPEIGTIGTDGVGIALTYRF